MAKAKKRRKERQRVDATGWADNQDSSFNRPSLSLPEDIEMLKIAGAGVKRFDIIPYKCGEGNPCADEGMMHFERTFYIHRGVGAGDDSYTCLRETAGKRCPICEFRNQLAKDPDADTELIKDLRAKKRQMWNIVDLGEPDKGVQLLEISYHNFGKMLRQRIEGSDPEDDYRYFADVEAGMTLRVNWVESSWGGGTFYEAGNIDFKPRKGALDDKVLNAVHCLDDFVCLLPYDKLKAILLETEEDKEEEEEETPAKTARGKKEIKEAEATEDDDDDGEWEFEGTEDNEDDDPQDTVAGEEDEEDEAPWEDEEEEEEEPKPKPKKKPAKAKGKKKPAKKKEPEPEPETEDDDDDDEWDDD